MSELQISVEAYEQMIAHCLDAYPLEGCGFLAMPPDSNLALACLSATNAAASSKIYSIAPLEFMKLDEQASQQGLEIQGVFHSHTHTEAYPSPTDVAQAPTPDWHYVLVSLAKSRPVVRSFRIVDGKINEEQVIVQNSTKLVTNWS